MESDNIKPLQSQVHGLRESDGRRPAADQQHDAAAVKLAESRRAAVADHVASEPRPPLPCSRGGAAAAAAPPALNLSPQHMQVPVLRAIMHVNAMLRHCIASIHAGVCSLFTRCTAHSQADIFALLSLEPMRIRRFFIEISMYSSLKPISCRKHVVALQNCISNLEWPKPR